MIKVLVDSVSSTFWTLTNIVIFLLYLSFKKLLYSSFSAFNVRPRHIPFFQADALSHAA